RGLMALLAPDVRRIAPSAAAPAPDRVPDRFAAGTPEPLRSQLIAALGADRVLTRVSDLVRYASDGSPYRLLPQAIVVARDIADNSGGMRCGVVHDSYQTVRSLTFVLPSGTVIDTAAPDAEERFAAAEPELARGLEEIRDGLRADAVLAERIRSKFRIKNTT